MTDRMHGVSEVLRTTPAIGLVIETLEMEQEFLTTTRDGKQLSVYQLCDIDRECYYAHMYAIRYLKLLKEMLK